MKNIVIIGAGDLGKEVVWLIEDINRVKPTYLILGFLDDDLSKNTYSFCGYRVLGGTDKLEELNAISPFSAVLAIQNGNVRKKIVEAHPNYDSWETIIHPSAVIASSTKIGKGCIFFPQVTVSVDSFLGDYGLFYINATICNDCWIGNCVSVMSNASVSEHSEIERESILPAGTCVLPHTKYEKQQQSASQQGA